MTRNNWILWLHNPQNVCSQAELNRIEIVVYVLEPMNSLFELQMLCFVIFPVTCYDFQIEILLIAIQMNLILIVYLVKVHLLAMIE